MASVKGESTIVPNWLELPRDVTSIILQKLNVVDIVMSASQVCSLWWNIYKDPSIWRTIVMINLRHSPHNLVAICCSAISRSCGLLEDINIEYFATDDLLFHIANINSTSNLRRLRLAYCMDVYREGWLKVLMKCPLLEELDVSYSNMSSDSLEVAGWCCPLLKTLKFNQVIFSWSNMSDDDEAFAIAKTMPQLRHLQMTGNYLTNHGLLAILHGCTLLEFLDLRSCSYVDLRGSLGEKCRELIKDVRFPLDEYTISDDYPRNVKKFC